MKEDLEVVELVVEVWLDFSFCLRVVCDPARHEFVDGCFEVLRNGFFVLFHFGDEFSTERKKCVVPGACVEL